MKTYPTISRQPAYGSSVYTFGKADGSNLRAEWDRKKGFWKFGRRNGLLDDSNPVLLEAPDLIRAHEDEIGRILVDRRYLKSTLFFEFWGDNSFAGNHEPEPHQVTLIDVAVDKRGILEPRDFVRWFDDVAGVAVLHHGPFDRELEDQIRTGTLDGMPFEGAVCKGSYVSPGLPLMFKVKTQAWLDRLKTKCGDDEALFERLR